MNVNYNDLLCEKAAMEFDEYKEMMLNGSAAEAFNHSCETAIKQELLMEFEEEDLPQAEASALYQFECPLDACYQEWLNKSSCTAESLRESICNLAAEVLAEQRKYDYGRW